MQNLLSTISFAISLINLLIQEQERKIPFYYMTKRLGVI